MIRRLLPALLLSLAAPAFANEIPQGPEWPFAESDLPADADWRFGTLPNGMRYLIRHNATPMGQAMVQFWVDAGSLSENDDELGYAHFIEHMAFNGSTRVPEGEMIKLLERAGLAFGADTNASTSFGTTLYKLDLPRADPALLDTALMLMRETASELTFSPAAVEREKGVVLSERRVRDTYALKNTIDQLQFEFPGSRFARRLPIGSIETLQGATADRLRALWQRLYRPGNTAIIVVGDIDPDLAEKAVRNHFATWQGPAPAAPPDAGPIDFGRAGQTDVFTDPALAEKVSISRHGPWLDQADTLEFRKLNVRRQIAYGILNRRFQRMARAENAPFRAASFGTGDVFESGRTTSLSVLTGDGEWRAGLLAAQAEYRRAMIHGFTEAEVAEQVANLRTALENNAAGAATRANSSFIAAALTLLEDDQVPTTPASALQRFNDHLPEITPQSVMQALREEALPLDNPAAAPLIRFEGRTAPAGGADALRAAWDEGMAATVQAPADTALAGFGYQDFGAPGTIASDTRERRLGIRTITFANGLKLNLKPTDLAKDRVAVELNVDGGQMLNTASAPLATAMTSALPTGGLGKHTIDELQSILAGRSVGFDVAADEETFRLAATTTPRDLELQLQLFGAALTDAAYRPEGEPQYQRGIRDWFARRTATPSAALSSALGGILSDGDPRFTLQPEESYRTLSLASLKDVIGDRLARGALELALVGDFKEDEAIALVARTLGALPAREPQFRPYAENRTRAFTADRTARILHHDGAADQALIRLTWPTRDDSDLPETLRLELLERIVRLELTDTLREELGQTYSPGVTASQSGVWNGYGTFAISAEVDVAQVDATRTATLDLLGDLATRPVDADVLLRARQPLLEAYDNALKTNGGWMGLVDRAQTEPERIERFQKSRALLAAMTAGDVQAAATRWLKVGEQVEVVVLPRKNGAAAGE